MTGPALKRAALVFSVLTAACSEADSTPESGKALVLSVGTGYSVDGRSGSIPGLMTTPSSSDPSALILAKRFLECGGRTFTFTYSDHTEEIAVPSTSQDIELVKCIQRKVDFDFEAALAPASDTRNVDPEPFRALHAKAD